MRRYLRQRKAKIPATMTASWLGLGGLLIVAFLALGAFLPRPHSEVPWFGIERGGKVRPRRLEVLATQRLGREKATVAAENQSKAGDGNASGKGGQPNGGSKGEKGRGKGNGGKGGNGEKGKGDGGDDKGKEEEGRLHEPRSERGARPGRATTRRKTAAARAKAASQSSPALGSAFSKVAGVVKWIVFAIVALLVVFGLFFFVPAYLRPVHGLGARQARRYPRLVGKFVWQGGWPA